MLHSLRKQTLHSMHCHIDAGPLTACSWPSDTEGGEECVQVWSVPHYDCAGLWYDRHMQACLLMRMQWEGDEWSTIVLYARQRKVVPGAIQQPLDWAACDAGYGEHLCKLHAGPVLLRSWLQVD